jgi:DNA ligase-1
MLPLSHVVATSSRLRSSAARSGKIAALAELLRAATPDEVPVVVAFLSGTPRQGKLGVGPSTARELARSGGAGTGLLTALEVDAAFAALAGLAGRGTAAQRRERLAALFARTTPAEATFLAELLVGELRQGALEGVMVEAVARAAAVQADAVRRALMFAGDLGQVAGAALSGGAAALAGFSLQLFRPILPMLAQASDSPLELIEELGEVALDYKLDGVRVQVHRSGADVRVFTRQLNDVTGAVPELVTAVRALPARELVLDGEAVVLTPAGVPRPFQVTMRRFGRKFDVERLQRELPLSPLFFDCLYLDRQALVDAPWRERAAALVEILPPALCIPRLVTAVPGAAVDFLARALAAGHEGLVAKALHAPYEAGRRGASWRKIKKNHTLDLVVLAAEWGSGRRRGRLSNLHLGARDPDAGGFVMVGKTFKGLTDALLQWQTRELLSRQLHAEGHVVHVRPELVVEIAFDDVQDSPHYPGGVALRFARVKRYRPDRTADSSDTIATLRALQRCPDGGPAA